MGKREQQKLELLKMWDMLSSNEVEMVSLGAVLLEKLLPENMWQLVIRSVRDNPIEYMSLNWDWTIKDHTILIHPWDFSRFRSFPDTALIKDPTRLLRLVPR